MSLEEMDWSTPKSKFHKRFLAAARNAKFIGLVRLSLRRKDLAAIRKGLRKLDRDVRKTGDLWWIAATSGEVEIFCCSECGRRVSRRKVRRMMINSPWAVTKRACGRHEITSEERRWGESTMLVRAGIGGQ